MKSESGSPVRLGRRPPPGDSAVDLLVDCHGRIRTFSDLAVRLTDACESFAIDDIANAAERVHRYFTVALPLHVADEDETLRPWLERHAPELLDILATLTREHREAEDLLAELRSTWQSLARAPAQAALRIATAAPAERLRALLKRHLALEEERVFPVLGQILSPGEERAIVAEFRARRAPR